MPSASRCAASTGSGSGIGRASAIRTSSSPAAATRRKWSARGRPRRRNPPGEPRPRGSPRGDDVGDAKPPARLRDTGDLGEGARLVGHEVRHTLRDHAAERAALDGQMLDLAEAEPDIVEPELAGVGADPGDRLGCRVDADDPTGLADLVAGEEDVVAGTAAERGRRLATRLSPAQAPLPRRSAEARQPQGDRARAGRDGGRACPGGPPGRRGRP